jgi:acetoin utilization deacetylase AcuC-like enzyme
LKRRLYYCDHHVFPLPEGHRFPQRKYALVRELLKPPDLFEFCPAQPAPEAAILRIHDAGYVRAFLDGTLDAGMMRRIGFPWSRELVARTLASVGGTLAATNDALARGWGGNLAGGTHHAFRDQGSGYCVFHDIAIAIEESRARGAISRAAVVDLDVHQGDGTASIYANDPDVLTLSIHGGNNFPFRKQASRIDISLEDHTGDGEYLEKLAAVLPEVMRFNPGLVFYQSGVDGLHEDRLGRLDLTHEGLRLRDRMVFESCHAAGVPVVITLGGGYAFPIELTSQAHANTYIEAARVFEAHLG